MIYQKKTKYVKNTFRTTYHQKSEFPKNLESTISFLRSREYHLISKTKTIIQSGI